MRKFCVLMAAMAFNFSVNAANDIFGLLDRAADEVIGVIDGVNERVAAIEGSMLKITSGIQPELVSCIRTGTAVRLNYVFTNTTDRDLEYCILSPAGSGHGPHRIVDKKGREYRFEFEKNGVNFRQVLFPVGGKVKATVVVYDVPTDVDSFRRVQLGITDKGQYAQEDEWANFAVASNVPISTVTDNVSHPGNMVCDNPNYKIKFISCKRVGSDAVIAFSLTNITDRDLDFALYQWYPKVTAYSDDGDSFSNSQIEFSGSPREFIVGQPVKGTITIPDVPRSVNTLSRVRLAYEEKDIDYKIEFMNVAVQ